MILCVMGAAAIACGSVKSNNLADAPPTPDAPAGPVTVTVLSFVGDGAADATAKVVFQDPDGGLVTDVAVDTAGKAQAMMPRGGSVTVVRIGTDNATSLTAVSTTMTGVKAGDDLTFGLKPVGTLVNQGGQTTMTATFTPLPQTQTPARYDFYTACGVASAVPPLAAPTVTLTFRDSCHGATFDLLVVASGGALTTPMFARLTNVAHQSGGAFTIPAGFTTMNNFTVNLTNVADPITSLVLTRSSVIDNIPVAPQTSASVDPPAGATSAVVPFAQAFGTRSLVQVALARGDAKGMTQTYEVMTPTLAQPVAIDASKLTLPWLTSYAMSSTGVSWSIVAAGDAPDGMVTQWAGRWTIGNKVTTLVWRVVQPADATGMTLPKLPAAYANVDPGQQIVGVTPVIAVTTAVDFDQANGYDDFRRAPETLISAASSLGVSIGMPYQRRTSTISARLGVR